MANNDIVLTNGRGAAASLAAGFGCLAMGIFTTLSEALPRFGNLLNFYGPVGPLSGKTLLTVVTWLICWGVLKGLLKDREVNLAPVFLYTLVLVGFGFVGTFPPFFDLIAD